MISKTNSRAACLAELNSNPKSFSNCPDLHGGVPGLISDVGDHEIPEALVTHGTERLLSARQKRTVPTPEYTHNSRCSVKPTVAQWHGSIT
jgi:hypothetical protein